MTPIDEPRGLKYLLILPRAGGGILRGRIAPGAFFVDLEQGLGDVVVVSGEDDEEGGCGWRKEEKTFFRKGVGVEEATSEGLVADRVKGLLIVAVEGGEIEVGGSIVNGPVEGVAAEKGVGDEGGEGKGKTGVAAGVVDTLIEGRYRLADVRTRRPRLHCALSRGNRRRGRGLGGCLQGYSAWAARCGRSACPPCQCLGCGCCCTRRRRGGRHTRGLRSRQRGGGGCCRACRRRCWRARWRRGRLEEDGTRW